MTESSTLYILMSSVFALEIISFFVFYSMISKGIRARKKEFSRIDDERAELLSLQKIISSDLQLAKKLSSETYTKLNRLASQVDSGWQETSQKVEMLFQELTQASHARITDDLSRLQKSRLSVEKCIKNCSEVRDETEILTQDARRLLQALDGSLPTEEILKEIQSEKYAKARDFLQNGSDATSVAKRLGLSLAEVSMLSFGR